MGAYWKKYGSALLRLKPIESVVALTVSNGWYANASDGTHSVISADSGWEGEYLKTVNKSTSPYGLNIFAKKKGKYIYKTDDGLLQLGEFEENELIAFYKYTGSSVRTHTIVIALEECTTPTSHVKPMKINQLIRNSYSMYFSVENFNKMKDIEAYRYSHTVYATSDDVSSATDLSSLNYNVTLGTVTTTEQTFDISNYTAIKIVAYSSSDSNPSITLYNE